MSDKRKTIMVDRPFPHELPTRVEDPNIETVRRLDGIIVQLGAIAKALESLVPVKPKAVKATKN